MRWISALQEDAPERRPLRLLATAALLVVTPALAAVAWDLVRDDGIPLVSDTDYRDEMLVPCPENVKEATAVGIAGLPADGSDLVVVDARTSGEYLAGHIPGAVNIPHRALNNGTAAYRESLAEDFRPLAGVPGSRIVVCGDERLGSGPDLAAVLLERGFDGVRYLQGGCEAWAAAGRPLERPSSEALPVALADLPADLRDLVIVDARFSRNYRKAHIPGAVSIPYRMVEGPQDERLGLLKDRPGVAIVVYGSEARGEGRDLAQLLASSAWPGVRFLAGGFEAWEAAGKPVEAEAAPAAEASGEAVGDGSSGTGGAP